MDKPISSKPKNKQYIKYTIGLIGLIGFSGAIVFASNGTSSGKVYNVEASSLVISKVSQGKFSEYLPLRGIVEPEETVFIDAIDGGRVEQV